MKFGEHFRTLVHKAPAPIGPKQKAPTPFGSGRFREIVVAAEPNGYTNRRMNASAVSATSRQPLSITSPWPLFGISTISVTPSFCFCFL